MSVIAVTRIGVAVAIGTAAQVGICDHAIANDGLPFKISAARQYVDQHGTDRIIVRLKDDTGAMLFQVFGVVTQMGADRVRSLSSAAIMDLTPVRRTGSGAHVMRLQRAMAPADVASIVERLKADPSVAHAEVDHRRFPQLVPSDPLFIEQWNLKGAPGGINAEAAWNTTQGSPSTVVAVLDTGILRSHRELTTPSSRILSGYDFVSGDPGVAGFKTANDGNGRDADPSDPGDFVTVAEAGLSPFQSCPEAMTSSWHGSHIAGIIAANGNNGVGTAGINWNTRILPVRVLGKCGGYASDTIDAVRWAAGLSVPAVPINPTPAHVINMSLGGPSACSIEEQSAIDAALRAGVRAIVVAAGNDAGAAEKIAPANCRSVIAVTGTDRNGSRAALYANVGANVAIAAPGGMFNSATDATNGILSLSNTGSTVPVADALAYVIGTSQSAAHVSGVVSLMLAANSQLSPYQVYWTLRRSARAFPNSTCSTSTCGAGIADAAAAVRAAASPPPDPAAGGLVFTPAPSAQPLTSTPPPGNANSAGGTPGGAASSSGVSGGGGGGCVMGKGSESDALLVLLALMALCGIMRGRVQARYDS
ncbi:MAG: S8 family peptidase [Burkholderiales bacterium]